MMQQALFLSNSKTRKEIQINMKDENEKEKEAEDLGLDARLNSKIADEFKINVINVDQSNSHVIEHYFIG